MADILLDFPIVATAERVFHGVTTPVGLDAWWTIKCSGQPSIGTEYGLWFGPKYDWRAVVTRCTPGREFELEMVRADKDWMSTRVGFLLEQTAGVTRVRFHHTGWLEVNEHYRISCFCWAMYLRLLKRNIETGEIVPYEQRLDV